MSSVAVLTPESFAEHRSGLKDQEITGNWCWYRLPARLLPRDLPAFEAFITLRLSACLRPSLSSALVCNLFASPHLIHVRLWGGPTGCVPEDEAYIPTYLEAFPPLPEKGAPGEKAAEQASAWGSKIRPIKASVITQVRHRRRPHAAV